MNELLSIRIVALLSVLIYFVFSFIDGRRVKDEREEMIQLKSLELAHKATLGVLAVTSVIYLFAPWMDALYVIQAIVLSALYTEMFGKIFYRAKL